jgi:carbonic anhydrase
MTKCGTALVSNATQQETKESTMKNWLKNLFKTKKQKQAELEKLQASKKRHPVSQKRANAKK